MYSWSLVLFLWPLQVWSKWYKFYLIFVFTNMSWCCFETVLIILSIVSWFQEKKNPQIWLTLSLHVLSHKKDFSDLWLLGLKGVD